MRNNNKLTEQQRRELRTAYEQRPDLMLSEYELFEYAYIAALTTPIGKQREEGDRGCTLTDQELIDKSFDWVKKLCDDGGKGWCLSVPVRFNVDPDTLFVELGHRLKEKNATITSLQQQIQSLKDEKRKL